MCIASLPESSCWSAKVRTTRSDQNQKLICGQGAQIRPFGIGQVSHHRGLLPHKTGATTYLIIAGEGKKHRGHLPRQEKGRRLGTSQARGTKLAHCNAEHASDVAASVQVRRPERDATPKRRECKSLEVVVESSAQRRKKVEKISFLFAREIMWSVQ